MSVAVKLRPWWTFLAAACMFAALGAAAHAQGPIPAGKRAPVKHTAPKRAAPKKPSRLSTLSGVYTDEQAQRGREVYLGTCRSCHSPESHTGATFNKLWRGKTLSDLYTFISLRMPKNDPGTMAAEDVADVMAYLLKMNRMPVGKAEIYPDPDSLKKFRIDVKSK